MPPRAARRLRSPLLFHLAYYAGCVALVWGGFRLAARRPHGLLLVLCGVALWTLGFLVAPAAPRVRRPRRDDDVPGG